MSAVYIATFSYLLTFANLLLTAYGGGEGEGCVARKQECGDSEIRPPEFADFNFQKSASAAAQTISLRGRTAHNNKPTKTENKALTKRASAI
jgi:hypothetical protein